MKKMIFSLYQESFKYKGLKSVLDEIAREVALYNSGYYKSEHFLPTLIDETYQKADVLGYKHNEKIGELCIYHRKGDMLIKIETVNLL